MTRVSSKDFLQAAAKAAAAGDPMQGSVRELIGYWDSKGRGVRVVQRVRTQLGRAKLVTEPDFRQVSLSTTVRLVSAATRPKETEEEEEEIARELALTVGTLKSSGGPVVSVRPEDTLHIAYTKMVVNDFSQLPVMSGLRSVKGAVTWRSMTQALLRSPSATLGDAMVDVTQVKFTDDLMRLVPRIVEEDFVLVLDAENKVGGIVTAADLTEVFAEKADAFLRLGEIDQRLRDVVRRRVPLERVRSLCHRPGESSPVETFDDLTMGDYQSVIENEEGWKLIGWPLDRVVVRDTLNAVREVRNDVTHFNPDPIDDERVALVRGFLTLLREHH